MKHLDTTLGHVPDARTLVEYEEPFQATHNSYCTYCRANVPGPVITIKQHWANRPLGQLISRCPQHWAYWQAAH